LVLVRYYATGSTQAVRRGRQYQFTAQTDVIYRPVPQDKNLIFLKFIFIFYTCQTTRHQCLVVGKLRACRRVCLSSSKKVNMLNVNQKIKKFINIFLIITRSFPESASEDIIVPLAGIRPPSSSSSAIAIIAKCLKY
jgi:hypothetical protein